MIYKIVYHIIIILFFTTAITQEIEPQITIERKKLLILASDNNDSKISQQITQIASSIATQLNRYIVIDRKQLESILNEQKLQYSGLIEDTQIIEIGKIAAANEALVVQINNFDQKGVPTKKQIDQDEKEEQKEAEESFLGWLAKEVVTAVIDKEMEDVERYPNNIQTVIDGEVRLINIETGESISSFTIQADHTGGIKKKSLVSALNQLRSQIRTNLKTLYKLSSEVLEIQGDKVILLLGKNMGVKSGTIFEIITREEKTLIRGREITIPGKSVGFVEVQTMSIDASDGKVLRKWNKIKPGYQAHELTEGIFSGGVNAMYGSNPVNMQLRLFGEINPFHRFGGTIYGDIGMVEDSRKDSDFQFGFGFALNYRLIPTAPFSLGASINMPFNFHIRKDDKNSQGVSNTVILPITSPRVGLQSEIMVSPQIDLVIKTEYVLRSINLGEWSYTEEQDDGETKSWNANWNDLEAPEIIYKDWIFSIGIRSTFFSSFNFE